MRILLIILATVMPVSAIAAPTVYDCVVTSGKGPFSDRMQISFSDGDDMVRIDDGVVQRFEGKAVDGTVGEVSNKKRVASWRVNATNGSGQTTKLAYRAAIFSNGKLVITAKPHGYRNVFNGRGRCRLVSS